MTNPIPFRFVLWLAPLTLAMSALAQEAEEAGEAGDEDGEDRQTIADLTENSDHHDGLFTLYRDRDTGETHMVVMPEHLNREYIYVSVIADGVVEGGAFRGNYRENRVLSVGRHFDSIEIRSENTAFHFDPDSPLSRAADANISSGLLASLPILAEDEDTGAMLVAADDLFASETLSQVKPSPNPDRDDRDRFELGSLSDDKSKITAIRNYPLNTDVHVEYVYEDSAPAVAGDEEVTDSRYVSIHLQHSLIAMPENGYRPRLTDHRMGYFAEQVTDLTDDSVTPYRDLVQRWDLVKRDPSAALSEPVEPIVWWIENTTPMEFRESIRQGVLAWNQSFEKIGFRNALQVRVQPDDADWDAGDIRYNVLRWTSSPNPPFSGYGPSFTNPRTGQIIGADIMLEFAGVTRRVHYQRILDNLDFSQVPERFEPGYCSFGHELHLSQVFGRLAVDALQMGSAAEERLIHEFLVDLTLHEVGHTLGFAHNFAASNMLTLDEIYDPDVVAERGLQASVMDYADIHIATGGREQTAYFGTQPGAYDDWIVEYSYSPALDDPGGGTGTPARNRLPLDRAATAVRHRRPRHARPRVGHGPPRALVRHDQRPGRLRRRSPQPCRRIAAFGPGEERRGRRVLASASRRLRHPVVAVFPLHQRAGPSDRRRVRESFSVRPARRGRAVRPGEPGDTASRDGRDRDAPVRARRAGGHRRTLQLSPGPAQTVEFLGSD